jgi:hypothetical protein
MIPSKNKNRIIIENLLKKDNFLPFVVRKKFEILLPITKICGIF